MRSLAERASMVYASTYITHGTGLAVAVRTGMATEVGQIAGTLEQMTDRPTPFQVEVGKMARQMTAIVGVLAVVVAFMLLFFCNEPPVDIALNTLSLAVATIPESLPIVLTFALALGARQMAARHAPCRRLSVVESLGSVDTICTDKTGTLTQNMMTVQRLFAGWPSVPAPAYRWMTGPLAEVLRAGHLCNEAMVEEGGGPARRSSATRWTQHCCALHNRPGWMSKRASQLPKVHVIPFSSERKMMTTVHQHDGR